MPALSLGAMLLVSLGILVWLVLSLENKRRENKGCIVFKVGKNPPPIPPPENPRRIK